MAQPFEGPMAVLSPTRERSAGRDLRRVRLKDCCPHLGTGGHLCGPVVGHSWDEGVKLFQALPCAPACLKHSCVQAAVVA